MSNQVLRARAFRLFADAFNALAEAEDSDETDEPMPYVCPECHCVGGESHVDGCDEEDRELDELERDSEYEIFGMPEEDD